MNSPAKRYLGLDIGEKRIGVAFAESNIPIAIGLDTINVDGSEMASIRNYVAEHKVDVIVIGYPRNMSGGQTAQTDTVRFSAENLTSGLDSVSVVYQDETLSSVRSEELLKQSGKPYQKGDIDRGAAVLILQDYLNIVHR